METRSARHSRYNINYHLVWIPKYREPVLVGDVACHLSEIFRLIAGKKGIEILGMEIIKKKGGKTYGHVSIC